jgi:Heterokaryon incompatibility protein (HET)
MESYHYRPINNEFEDIRLLHLLPGSQIDPIRINIIHTRLRIPDTEQALIQLSTLTLGEDTDKSSAINNLDLEVNLKQRNEDEHIQGKVVNFEALSYVWGQPEPSESVFIPSERQVPDDKGATNNVLKVGPNLASALRSLRYSTEPRTLWVDAICINQMDIDERCRQVTQMGTIYSLAQKVVVWLGEEENDSSLAIQTLDELATTLQNETNKRGPRYKDTTKLPYDQSMWEAIHELLTRSWFSRLWILQEVQLANNDALVQCGDVQIPWNKMKDAIHALYRNLHVPIAGFRQSIDDADNTADELKVVDVEEILLRACSRGSTDPRDKIYGTLNLLPSNLRALIEVHYDWGVVDVFKNAILAINKSISRLNLLGFGVNEELDFDGPTWTPRFHSSFPFTPKTYHLCSGISSSSLKIIDNGIIEVTGKLCGTISSVGPKVPELLEDFEHFFDLLKDDPSLQSHDKEKLQEIILKCLVASQLSNRLPDIIDSFTIQELRDMVDSVFCGSDVETEAWVEADSVLDRALFMSHGMRLVTTEDGMICLAPSNVRSGKSQYLSSDNI